MDEIIRKVLTACRNWKKVADHIGISKVAQELMSKAFYEVNK